MKRHDAGPPQILFQVWRARLHTIVFPKGAHSSIDDDLGAVGKTLSSQVVVQKALTEPYLRFAVKGETQWAGHTILSEGALILITRNPHRDSAPARTRI